MIDETKFGWAEAISFMQRHVDVTPDDNYAKLIWKKLQLGNRTQDILMDIRAIKALQDDLSYSSPEWQNAVKWLSYQRAQQTNLMLDLLWAQLETGDRTPELLNLIRNAANAPVSSVPEVPVSIDTTPPSKDF